VRTFGQRCVDNKQAKRKLGDLVAGILGSSDVATRVAALRMAEPILRAVSWS
jgi:hypothetical protein